MFDEVTEPLGWQGMLDEATEPLGWQDIFDGSGADYYEDSIVLCAASAYTQKYYFNDEFAALPEQVQQELQILCVLFTEDVGGTVQLVFDEDGNLSIQTEADEGDILYDEIGSVLKVKQLQREKRELFEALETYFRVFFLGETE